MTSKEELIISAIWGPTSQYLTPQYLKFPVCYTAEKVLGSGSNTPQFPKQVSKPIIIKRNVFYSATMCN